MVLIKTAESELNEANISIFSLKYKAYINPSHAPIHSSHEKGLAVNHLSVLDIKLI